MCTVCKSVLVKSIQRTGAKMSDSDNSLFITQSSTCVKDNSNSEVETDSVLSGVVDMENLYKTRFYVKNDLFSDISSEDDNILIQASANAESKENQANCDQGRFLQPLKEVDLQTLVNQGKCRQTENKARWAVNLFNKWKTQRAYQDCERHFPGPLLDMEPDEMSDALSYFITEVRNESGKEYRPNTVYEIVISIQHYLRSNGKFVSFLDDEVYSKMKSILNAKMKELSKQGLGLDRKQADIISLDQEETLWSLGILGSDNPTKLLNTMIYLNGLNFALRAGKEHRNLRCGPHSQIKLLQDANGRRYLQYTEDISKTNSGGLTHRKVTPKTTRAYENKNQDRCIVNIYIKYMEARPVNGKTDAFYLRPKSNTTGTCWFMDSPVGVHTLQGAVKNMCEDAGFNGYFTNHSLRATAATRLYSAGIDEQLIAEKTGHRSNAVRTYKRTSDQQQQVLSDIIRGDVNAVTEAKRPKIYQESSLQNTSDAKKEIFIKDGAVEICLKY